MKTVNDLVRVLSHHAQLVKDVAGAERALMHGGSPPTMQNKQAALEDAQRTLEQFLAEPLDKAADSAYL